jgi:hypothetical protein
MSLDWLGRTQYGLIVQANSLVRTQSPLARTTMRNYLSIIVSADHLRHAPSKNQVYHDGPKDAQGVVLSSLSVGAADLGVSLYLLLVAPCTGRQKLSLGPVWCLPVMNSITIIECSTYILRQLFSPVLKMGPSCEVLIASSQIALVPETRFAKIQR